MSLADKRHRAEVLRRELSAARVGQQETLAKDEEAIQSERLDKEIAALEAELRLTQGGGGSTEDAKAAMEAAAAVAAGIPAEPVLVVNPPALGLALDVNNKGSEGKK